MALIRSDWVRRVGLTYVMLVAFYQEQYLLTIMSSKWVNLHDKVDWTA